MDLGLREAAGLFRVSESTVARWVKAEGLPAFLVNDRYRFNRVDLLEWANHRRLPLEADDAGTLRAALQAGGVHHGVPGGDARSALAAAAERLPLPAAERGLAARVLAEREDQCSTALGDGVAIPHPRKPLVFPVERASVTLCLLERDVDFGAADGKPVGALFLVLSPTARQHLTLLAQLAAALHRPALRAALARRAPAPELLACLEERP